MADLQELSRCLVKYFNISGSEFVGYCIKSTRVARCRVLRGEGVGVAVVIYLQAVFKLSRKTLQRQWE